MLSMCVEFWRTGVNMPGAVQNPRGGRHMILVTGADGFVGSNTIEQLVKDGERPRALVRNLARARTRLSPDAAIAAELVQGDTTQPDTLPNALAGVDTVIHAAF